jgi:hypothetical protein
VQPITEKTKPLDPEIWLRFDAALDGLCAVRPKLDAKKWAKVIERVRARPLASARKEALARLAQTVDRCQALADRSSPQDDHLRELKA